MSKAKTFVRKVLPIVLTVVGSASTVAAVIFAAKEGPRYEKLIEETGATGMEKVKIAVTTFGPAIACAATSVACGVGAHMLDLNTQASLTGGYIALKEASKKYREKNLEINGEEADKKVMTKIMEEKLPENVKEIDCEKKVIVYLDGLCDDIPEIIFESTRLEIMENIYSLNKILTEVGSFTANDVLDIFGQDKRPECEDIGWSSYMMADWEGVPWVEFDQYLHADGSITLRPIQPAYGGYLTDYDLDY